MYNRIFNTKKTWLGAMLTFALVAIMGLTFAFKPFAKNPAKGGKYLTYYFKFNGTPGQESNQALWERVSDDAPSCGGDNDGCLIEVDAAYTTTSGSNIILNQAVPVVSISGHTNPDESSAMIVSASNRN